MTDFAEAREMALAASHKAELAASSITAHEKLCAERYEAIKIQLASIPAIFATINAIKATTDKSSGMWVGATRLALVVTLICGIIGLLAKVFH